jgi:DNA-binding NtrC family response regulator
MMPGMDGIALLRAALEIDPHLVCIIMTGQATVSTARGSDEGRRH